MKPRTGERSAASRKVLYGEGNYGLTESDVGENEMEELILICEDSVEGILTAIYRIYEWKLCGKRVKIQTGASDLCLFTQYREVMPDAECAAKVARTLRRRFGEQAWEAISYALASEEADKSQAVYETIAAGLSGRIRGPLLQALAEPCIHRVFALSRSVHRVRERVLQFLRFQEITGGILYGEIAPDADVLAFVMPHFADRFPLENFVILDERRAAAGIHPAGKAWFLTKLSKQELDTLQQAGQQKDENEQEIEVLFQSFCRSLSILERQNQPLQQQLVPLKYRMHMTEFQKK